MRYILVVSILECPRMSASFTTPPSPWRKGGLSSPPRSGCLLSPFPLLVRKISPEAIYLAYFTSFRYSFPGRRMVRGFLLSDISVLISRINYIDMHFSSLILTTVAHMVSIRSSSRSLPGPLLFPRAGCILLYSAPVLCCRIPSAGS